MTRRAAPATVPLAARPAVEGAAGITLESWDRRRGAGLLVVPPDKPDDLH